MIARALALIFEPPPPRSEPPAAQRVIVLGGAADTGAAGCATALTLARGPVVAATWGASAGEVAPAGALPAAAREATRLRELGFDAQAAGRVARVTLAAGAGTAAAQARRLAGATRLPLAIALGGPRDERFDELLAEADAIVAVGGREAPAALVEATVAELRAAGLNASRAELELSVVARSWLALGLAPTPPAAAVLRRALA